MNKRTISLSGHIIDSLTLTKTMGIIMDKGGEFDILEIDVGRKKSDVSHAKIEVQADSPELLESILDELSVLGASIDELKEVQLVASTKDKVAPEGFYSSSNHTTHIFYKGEWILVEEIEMDCLVVVDEDGDGICDICDVKYRDCQHVESTVVVGKCNASYSCAVIECIVTYTCDAIGQNNLRYLISHLVPGCRLVCTIVVHIALTADDKFAVIIESPCKIFAQCAAEAAVNNGSVFCCKRRHRNCRERQNGA